MLLATFVHTESTEACGLEDMQERVSVCGEQWLLFFLPPPISTRALLDIECQMNRHRNDSYYRVHN